MCDSCTVCLFVLFAFIVLKIFMVPLLPGTRGLTLACWPTVKVLTDVLFSLVTLYNKVLRHY